MYQVSSDYEQGNTEKGNPVTLAPSGQQTVTTTSTSAVLRRARLSRIPGSTTPIPNPEAPQPSARRRASWHSEEDAKPAARTSGNPSDKLPARGSDDVSASKELPSEITTASPKKEVQQSVNESSSGVLLRIMRERPFKLPVPITEAASSPAEWQDMTKQQSSFNDKEGQASTLNRFSKLKKPKAVFKANAGAVRQAFLLMPHFMSSLQGSDITYSIFKLAVSQTEIAEALSHWHATQSGHDKLNANEPSQKEALRLLEGERGRLLPAHFLIQSVQYTKPRVFDTTAALIRCHDLLVIIEGFDPLDAKSLGYKAREPYILQPSHSSDILSGLASERHPSPQPQAAPQAAYQPLRHHRYRNSESSESEVEHDGHRRRGWGPRTGWGRTAYLEDVEVEADSSEAESDRLDVEDGRDGWTAVDDLLGEFGLIDVRTP